MKQTVSITSFLLVAVLLAFAAFMIFSSVAPGLMAKPMIAFGICVIAGIKASALLHIIMEPVKKGSYVILPSNIQ